MDLVRGGVREREVLLDVRVEHELRIDGHLRGIHGREEPGEAPRPVHPPLRRGEHLHDLGLQRFGRRDRVELLVRVRGVAARALQEVGLIDPLRRGRPFRQECGELRARREPGEPVLEQDPLEPLDRGPGLLQRRQVDHVGAPEPFSEHRGVAREVGHERLARPLRPPPVSRRRGSSSPPPYQSIAASLIRTCR